MDIMHKMDKALGGFLRGQLTVCCLVALSATIGLSLVGMWQYALLVGVLAGAFNIIPYLGPVMGLTPALLWALIEPSHETWEERALRAGLGLIVFVVIQMMEGFIFQPKIVGKNSNLHPLLVMLALIIGAQFGLVGMIMAVPLASVGRVLFLELVWYPYRKQNLEAAEAE